MADKIYDEDATIVTLEFEDGSSEECEFYGIFDYKDKEYVALYPYNGTDDVYIYEYAEYDDGSTEFIEIKDDKQFREVAVEFESIMESLEEEDNGLS